MQNSNGQNESLSGFVKLHGKEQLIQSIRNAHDWILYDSNLKIGKQKKDVLHDLKVLADQLEKTV